SPRRRRPATLPRSRSAARVHGLICSGTGPRRSRSRARSAGTAGRTGHRTADIPRPCRAGPGWMPSLPASWHMRSIGRGPDRSSLLVRQNGPVFPFRADHFEGEDPMRSRGFADLHGWQLDRANGTPLFQQIYMQVRSAVLSGALRPGTKLPSSRAMASRLGVARASVDAAYEQLLAEGCVEGRHGSGTFVSADLDGLASPVRRRPRAASSKPRSVSATAQAFADFERPAAQTEARPFNTGRTLI